MLTRFALRRNGRAALLRTSFSRELTAGSGAHDDVAAGCRVSKPPNIKLVKRKVAIVGGYMGTSYHGLQLNGNVNTIENELRRAIFDAGAMRESNFEDLGKIDWARSSRTDKGVHAGCVVFSGKLLIDEENKVDHTSGRVNGLAETLNASLPENVRVFSCTRVNKRFSARKNCVLREYEYFMPLSFLRGSALGSDEKAEFDTEEAVAEFCRALRRYEGVNDFHNFTRCRSHFYKLQAKREQWKAQNRGDAADIEAVDDDVVEESPVFDDDDEEEESSAVNDYSEESSQFGDEEALTRKLLLRHRRSVYSCSGSLVHNFCGQPFLRIHIVGQAFLLNQIRCMVGGALAVATKGMSRVAFDAALLTNRIVRVPIAPAEGLVLLSSSFGGKLHTVSLYEDPNTVLAKERKDLKHRVLLNSREDKEMMKFREEVIYKEISRSWDMEEKMDPWRAYLGRCYKFNERLDEDELLNVLYELDETKLAIKKKNQLFVERNRIGLTEKGRQGALLPKQFTTKFCIWYSVAPGIFTSDLRRAVTWHLKLAAFKPSNFGGFGGDGNPFNVQFNFGDFPQRFNEHYRVYPVSFCDKGHLEDGDKILLPPSALEMLARLHIEYPMLFKVINEGVERSSHCGVLEFSAPEGSCYMPYWMMQNLFVKEGGILNIQNVSLPKATFVKLRPQSQDFLDISNPRAVLEGSLRTFSCMTVGDTICLKYNNKNYMLDVREVKPAPAACIIETDCEVDFEPPADYNSPALAAAAALAAPAVPSDIPYGGVPTMKAKDTNSVHRGETGFGSGLRLKKSGEKSSTDAAALRAARLRKYEAFHGAGRSLSGKTSTFSSASFDGSCFRSSNSRLLLNGGSNSSSATGISAKPSVSYRLNGEAVHLADANEEVKDEEMKESGDSKPFQGEGRRLR
ncbi:unnamed protein product [Peronospora destructor]|uniref:Pseudouridine synthase I TruA alpha/beta domain-containing protein n=1 Tax=Peronospora destructor TaxID=86335 RepID=A0AAV0U7S1_9STRA|nr:unnamed protein product [Peronospora destructor]